MSHDDMNLARHLEREKCSRKAEECVEELRLQLAASQAREGVLRKAAELAVRVFGEGEALQAESVQQFRNLLSQPPDTTALSTMIAKAGEVMREHAITEFCEPHIIGVYFIEKAIRALPGVTLEDLK